MTMVTSVCFTAYVHTLKDLPKNCCKSINMTKYFTASAIALLLPIMECSHLCMNDLQISK